MRRRKVFCSGCANLMYMPGLPPQCVATAEFVSGPLRPRISVIGRVPAEKRNRHNDCQYRESVSVRAYRLKRWILWRVNDEGKGGSVREERLKTYSVATEYGRAKAYLEEYGDATYPEQDEPDEIGSEDSKRIERVTSRVSDGETYSEEDEDFGSEYVLDVRDVGVDDGSGAPD